MIQYHTPTQRKHSFGLKNKKVENNGKPLLRSLPIALKCIHNTGVNGQTKVGCGSCKTYGCNLKGTVRLKDCANCSQFDADLLPSKQAGLSEQQISWPVTLQDWTINGDWIKAPDVWEKFNSLIVNAMDYHKTLQPLHGEGNGIVIVGGGKYFASSYCNIRLLRHYGCNLPIELWYLGSKDEMPEKWQKIVEPYGVTCRDGDAERDVCPMRILNGWELKFYAIQQSCFRRVLFLDADCFPMREPSFVFDDPRFLGAGAVFQRDTINGSFQFIKPEVLKMFGIQRESKIWDIESGACLIDRTRWSNALRLTVFLNGYSDLIYKVVYGDKTTPAIASMLTGMAYAIPAYAPNGGAWGLMQKWFDGSKMWQHRIHCKPRLDTQAFHSSQIRKLFPKIAWDTEIMQYLEDLRRLV